MRKFKKNCRERSPKKSRVLNTSNFTIRICTKKYKYFLYELKLTPFGLIQIVKKLLNSSTNIGNKILILLSKFFFFLTNLNISLYKNVTFLVIVTAEQRYKFVYDCTTGAAKRLSIKILTS